MKKKKPKISIIIPGHNEAENIGRVLKSIVKVKELNEILVVADACEDDTAGVARKFKGVKVLERKTSSGKGSAMIAGVKATKGDIVMFADADLESLTPEHVTKVLKPVIEGKAIMSIGLRDRVFGLGAIIPKIYPMYAIGGERAMTRKFFNNIPKDKNTLDFGIETVMNYYARYHKLKVAMPVLKDLRQIIKEKKWGFWHGFVSRLGLMKQVWRTRRIMKHKKDI
ncbi:MAG TPA: glycosyltransferase family 2 protein [Patescibacteria group bacterium]|nr:glycosyltransferase family 2 protein [Patescibacteria group bacterium]